MCNLAEKLDQDDRTEDGRMDELKAVIVDSWSGEEKKADIADIERGHLQSTYFISACAPSPFHWHFHQAYEALRKELFLPGVSGLLNGIEASLRTTLTELGGRPLDGDLGSVMNNSLLRAAEIHGMAIDHFAFPGEDDFRTKLPTKDGVRLVRLRNDICHGNFQSFVGKVAGSDYFVPESLAQTAALLLQVSFNWTRSVADFRHSKGLRTAGSEALIIPENPLAKWLV